MSSIEFNKCAVNMGKVLKMLENTETQIKSSYDLISQKEELLVIAYVCRVGIMDRIEQYPSWVNNNWTVRIPTGIFSHKTRKMEEAIEMTVGKLLQITSNNREINEIIESVLSRGNAFYEFENMLPFSFKQEVNK